MNYKTIIFPIFISLLLGCSTINKEQQMPNGFKLVKANACYMIKTSNNINYISGVWKSREGAVAYATWYNTIWGSNKIQ